MSLWGKIVEVQKIVSKLEKKKTSQNAFAKNKYSSLDDIYQVLDKGLNEVGVGIVHYPDKQDDQWYLITELFDDKEQLQFSYPMKVTENKQMNLMQAFCAANTYTKRYTLENLFRLSGSEDNDGVGAFEIKQEPKQQPRQQSRPKNYATRG